jgi:Ca2+-binding EF-hand superfamily protein
MNRKTLFIPMLMTIACGAALAHGGDRFKMMDTNGDGQISSEEHAAGVKMMFANMDTDKDGFVTATEMDAYHASKMKGESGKAMGHEMTSADKIKTMDTDGDGKMSAAEHDAGAASMFTKMDVDANGSISRAEMEKGEHEMMKADKKADTGHAGHDMKPEAKPTGTE